MFPGVCAQDGEELLGYAEGSGLCGAAVTDTLQYNEEDQDGDF